jgi:CRP/FNR family transcriptional regulator, cyclic AMP receptor protein
MRTPYGLNVIESCLACPMSKERLFCNISRDALARLDEISSSATYPKGAVLFVEGQEPRGTFVICNGRIKLTASAPDGKSLILRIAAPGELVGLPGTISGKPYEATAEALEPIQVNFIPRNTFLQFLRDHGEVAVRVAEVLCEIYLATYQEVRYLALSGSAAGKFARFLLDVASDSGESGAAAENVLQRFNLTLTHEEIAQIIGSSRETVTRLFADFKRKRLIKVQGAMLMVCDKNGLEKIINSSPESRSAS